MLYHHNRPVHSRHPHVATYYQWRAFSEEALERVEDIRDELTLKKEETRTERYFLVPGRAEMIPRLVDDQVFEIHSLIKDEDGLELWEKTLKTSLPFKRTFSAMIGAKIPRFRGACSSVADAESLTETLAKKSQYHEVKTTRKIFSYGKVRVELCEIEREGERHTSLSLQGDTQDDLRSALRKLGLKANDNTHLGKFLSAA